MTVTLRYSEELALPIMREHGLKNETEIFYQSIAGGLNLAPACALMEKETHGANLWGHDAIRNPDGSVAKYGTFYGLELPPSEQLWTAFWHEVNELGKMSNGVGPAQITSRGLLQAMVDQGLRPWKVADNMRFGFRLLASYYDAAVADGARGQAAWVAAGKTYNGSTQYGEELAQLTTEWRELLAPARSR